MKFCLGLLIAVLLLITACKKDHDDDNKVPPVEETGCIERIYSNKNDHIINSADVAAVNKLFADNNIDYSNFRYERYTNDSIRAQVRVEKYANGLHIFNGSTIYYFTKGILDYNTGMPIDVTGSDTISHAQLQYLKWMFLNDMQKDKMRVYGNYVDSCVNAELGLWQLPGDGNTSGKAVKAWLVKGKVFYPLGVYKDEDGSQITYTNGIYLY